MTFLWSKDFLSYALTSVTSQLTGYEAAKLPILDAHPYLRSWRSNNQVTQQDIIVDFGSSKSVAAIFLGNCNFATVQVAHDADNIGIYIDLAGSPFPVNRFWNYYRLSIVQNFTDRFVRIRIPAQTPVDGAAYFELGSLLFLSTVNTLTNNPAENNYRETLQREYEESGGIAAGAGPFYLEQEEQFIVQQGNIAQYRTLALLGKDTPFWLFENNAKTEECYLLRGRDAVTFEYRGQIQNVNPRFRELV